MTTAPERWLRGPVPEVPALLQPVAHALLQAADDVESVVSTLSPQELGKTPGGAASVAFHCRHLAGSIDRLFTYARGEALSDEQRKALRGEGESAVPPEAAGDLVTLVRHAVERALEQLRATRDADLPTPREVGRAKLPSTTLGLLFHAAEHASRHAGQITTTAKIVRGLVGAGH